MMWQEKVLQKNEEIWEKTGKIFVENKKREKLRKNYLHRIQFLCILALTKL